MWTKFDTGRRRCGSPLKLLYFTTQQQPHRNNQQGKKFTDLTRSIQIELWLDYWVCCGLSAAPQHLKTIIIARLWLRFMLCVRWIVSKKMNWQACKLQNTQNKTTEPLCLARGGFNIHAQHVWCWFLLFPIKLATQIYESDTCNATWQRNMV